MFERVTVGLKEGLAHAALLELVRKATAPGGMVHLVTLVRAGSYEDEPQRLKAAERDLEKHSASLRQEGYEVSHECNLIVIAAAADLVRIADEHESDLVIIGLAKRSRVGKALMGSDAQRVLLGASCPVLVTHLYT
jgi:nucleotide-binding universal stress UspA family protein